MKKVFVFLANGFEEVEALTPVDVIRRAGAEVITVSVENSIEVCGAHNIKVLADALFDEMDFQEGNLFVLPGGMPGAENLKKHLGLNKLLKSQQAKGKYLAAICAAPMVLGNLNLLDNKKATCYPGFEKYLGKAVFTGMPFETDGNIITGKGIGTAMEFSLELVKILFGVEKRDALAARMMVVYK